MRCSYWAPSWLRPREHENSTITMFVRPVASLAAQPPRRAAPVRAVAAPGSAILDSSGPSPRLASEDGRPVRHDLFEWVGDEAQSTELSLGLGLVHQLRDDPAHKESHLDLQAYVALLARLERECELLLGLGRGGHHAIAGGKVDKVKTVRLRRADLLPVEFDVRLNGSPKRHW